MLAKILVVVVAVVLVVVVVVVQRRCSIQHSHIAAVFLKFIPAQRAVYQKLSCAASEHFMISRFYGFHK